MTRHRVTVQTDHVDPVTTVIDDEGLGSLLKQLNQPGGRHQTIKGRTRAPDLIVSQAHLRTVTIEPLSED